MVCEQQTTEKSYSLSRCRISWKGNDEIDYYPGIFRFIPEQDQRFTLENTEQTKGALKELYHTFFSPLISFWKNIEIHIHTSLKVLSFNGLPELINKHEKKYLRDVDYAFVSFQFLLITLFITKVFNLGANLEEFEETLQDLMLLVLFFLCLTVFVLTGRLWRYVFGIKESARTVDAFFIYEFNFLFLPSYLLMYPVYLSDANDEDVLGGAALLLIIFWFFHLLFYFFKLCRTVKAGSLVTGITVIIIPIVAMTLLFASVFSLLGAVLLE